MAQNNGNLLILILPMMLLFSRCIDVNDTFRSEMLVSSNGEKLYVNTLNWGVTGDHQYTIITRDADRLKDRADTVGAVNGLSPFVYTFKADTLSVFYLEWKEIDIKEKFESIAIDYNPLGNSAYTKIVNKAVKREDGYQLVP